MMRTAIARELAPSEQTWDLTEIYATQEDWEADALGIEDDTAAIVAYRGRFGEGAAVLLACLRARDALLSRLMSYGQYARLPFAVDGTSPRHQEMEARASALSGRVNAALAFIDIEILGLDSEQVTAYLDEEPGLRDYRSQVEALRRRRPHTLSLEAEQLLAALADTLDTPYMVYQRTVASDLTFESVHDAAGREIVMSLTAYQALAQSPDREARRRAYESLIGGLDRHTATVAATLAACIRRNVTLARLRGYTSATEMALAAQQVPIATYRAFLDAARDAAVPLIQRLMRIRGQALGVDQLRAYDLTAPLVAGDAPVLSFAEGRALILDALRPLGAEYGAIIERAFAGRWIDWANTLGKPHGAFAAPIYAVHAYIWLPWQGTLRDVFLLAHELGHAGHFDLARRHQTYGNTVGEQGRGLFLETPSTVNELLLGRHMLDTAREPGLRRRALLQVLDTFVGSMAVALGGAHLEQRLYDMAEGGDAITLTAIMEAQADIFTRFYGEAIAVDDGVRLRWMQAPHMYWSDLRQSTYAAGLCGACGVTEAIRAEGQPAVDRWLDTLRAGIRLSPLDLMRRTGVDLTSPEGLWQTIDVFARLADDLERNIALTAV